MEPKPDGRALEAFIKSHLGPGAPVVSMLELSRIAGLRPNTLYGWFTGTSAPRTGSLARVAVALDVPLSSLLDAYEGRSGLAVSDKALQAIEEAVGRGVETAIRRLRDEGVLSEPAEGDR